MCVLAVHFILQCPTLKDECVQIMWILVEEDSGWLLLFKLSDSSNRKT